MSIQEIGARNTACVVLAALETAEERLVPQGYSRLHLAVRVAKETIAFISYESHDSRRRLATALEFLRECESNCCYIDAQYPADQFPERQRQLHPDSIVGRGFAMATHVGQAALAGVSPSVEHCLSEAQDLVKLAARQAA